MQGPRFDITIQGELREFSRNAKEQLKEEILNFGERVIEISESIQRRDNTEVHDADITPRIVRTASERVFFHRTRTRRLIKVIAFLSLFIAGTLLGWALTNPSALRTILAVLTSMIAVASNILIIARED